VANTQLFKTARMVRGCMVRGTCNFRAQRGVPKRKASVATKAV